MSLSSPIANAPAKRKRRLRRARPALYALLLVVVISVAVEVLPADQYQLAFDAAAMVAKRAGGRAEIVIFGDSRSTMYHTSFFRRLTLSFSCPNQTVIYSKLLYDRMVDEGHVRPKVLLLFVGANNYNENGLFPRRDYAIRRLVGFRDIVDIAHYPGGFAVAADAILARLFPVYGRRVEIRSMQQLGALLTGWGRRAVRNDVQGMKKLKPKDLAPPHRSKVADRNYWLIYRRSVYRNYKLSRVHTGMLEALIDRALAQGTRVAVIQPPVEPMMRKLEKKMVGDRFDAYLRELEKKKPITRLDLRDDLRFQFADLNHLTRHGGRAMVRRVLEPLVERLIRSGH